MAKPLTTTIDPETGISVTTNVEPTVPNTEENREIVRKALEKFDRGAERVIAILEKRHADFETKVKEIEKYSPGNARWLREHHRLLFTPPEPV